MRNPSEYVEKRVQHWKEALEIPSTIRIITKFATNNESQDIDFADCDLSMYEYGEIKMRLFDEVFRRGEKDIDIAICHEMLHVFLHPLTAYCINMFGEDCGKKYELRRIEEYLIEKLERILSDKGRSVRTRNARNHRKRHRNVNGGKGL